MMPHFIFHQNMRVFSGENGDRNGAFDNAFTSIRGRMGNDRFLVAGFTEVMDGYGARAPLYELALALDMGLGEPELFAVGQTAGGQVEWVGISVANGFDVQIQGKVLRMAMDLSWRAFPVPAVAASALPDENYSADIRGLAYVGGSWRGENWLFGYIHNVYTVNERTVPYRALPAMVEAIHRAHREFDWGNRLYIGGDLNVPPDDVGNLRLVHGQVSSTRGAIMTTTANAYDFWLTTDPTRRTENARVYTQTRWDGGRSRHLSDHAGVGLRIT